jgi:hypothetical protein
MPNGTEDPGGGGGGWHGARWMRWCEAAILINLYIIRRCQ